MNLEDLVLFQRFQITGYTDNPTFEKEKEEGLSATALTSVAS